MVKRWQPSQWAGLIPNGIGSVKPNHYKELLSTIWENKDQLPLAWRILNDGVCDGCALGTTGMRDFTMTGIHLCTVRLNLLRLNTMGPIKERRLTNVRDLSNHSGKDLRNLGRLAYPMIRKKGEPGFTRASWNEALDLIAGRIRITDPQKLAFYITSRGVTNEVYYAAQKLSLIHI